MSTGPRQRPLVLIPTSGSSEGAPFGSYRAVLGAGLGLLGSELSQRLAGQGASVAPLLPVSPGQSASTRPFSWGRWFVSGLRETLAAGVGVGAGLDAVGWAGAGALALMDEASLEELLSPVPGEAVANNRFSADALVARADGPSASGHGLERLLDRLEGCATDNEAPRRLETAGFAVRDLGGRRWSRFDVDTPLDLALLSLAASQPGARRLDRGVDAYLAMARLPGNRPLVVPHLDPLGEILRDRTCQLVVAGRVPGAMVALLETDAACRVRWFVEERGMRSARDAPPRSLLARWVEERGPAALVEELSRLGDGVILDSRVLMASLAASSDATRWPPDEERFASDFGDSTRIATPWLRELTDAASASDVPVLMGGHGLISDGLRIVLDAAWSGR